MPWFSFLDTQKDVTIDWTGKSPYPPLTQVLSNMEKMNSCATLS